MNIRKLTTNGLLLAIGALLHQITPAIFFGMKPDFSLIMLFVILMYNEDYKTCISAGIIAGILAAATTTFPGGQIPNVIDKIITTNIMFFAIKLVGNSINKQVKMILTTLIGTFISGTVFLTSALILAGLPASFEILFLSVVLPACIVNTIMAMIVFNSLNIAMRGRTTI
ncbi:MAG: tryptophan transporter [Clostridium sp.]|nr:tryptophan transporter [Clostridium sp.]